MKSRNHLARWVAAGVSALVLSGVGTAAASTTPPSEPPADTTATTDDAASEGSEPMTGAGPSDCPAITATAETEGTMAPDAEAAATTEAAGSEAPETSAAEGTTADEGTMDMGTMMMDTTSPDGSAAPADGPFVQIVETDEYGPILVDGECRTLYGFTQDVDGESACFDDCAVAWPPLFVPDDAVPPLADELDPTLFSVVEHPEGAMLKVGDWPLYYFAEDIEPGDINGQAVGGVWWVVSPDGTLIETPEGGAETTDAAAGSEPTETAVATTSA